MYRVLLPVDHDPDRLDEQLDALFDLPGQDELSVTVIHVHEEVDSPADEAGEYVIDSLNRDIAELQGIPETVDRAVSELEEAGVFEDLQTSAGDPVEEIIEAGENLDHVNVTVTGTVPEVEAFSYDPPQSFEAMTLTREGGGDVAEIETVSVHHYTSDSADARSVLDDARSAVNNSDSDEARNRLDTAISAFEDGSFDAARTAAEDAKSTAESAESSAQTMQYVLYGVGAIVVLALIGGGIYYYRSQQDDYDKLR